MSLDLTYPDVPMGGKLDDVLHFAWAHTLPVFRFVYFPIEAAVIVFCWMEITFGLIPLAFVYMDASFDGSTYEDSIICQWVMNMPTLLSPLTRKGGSDGLGLLCPPDSLYLPFVPSAPVWPQNAWLPPNPYLQFVRGGNVPCDASGLAALAGAFV